MTDRPLVIVDVAGLGWDLVRSAPDLVERFGWTFQPMETTFPALTCPVQASFRTAAHPCFHGVVANGFYARRLARPFFWEQSSALVFGRRIWSRFRTAGRRVAMLFWQQSLGEEADMLLSPRPIHLHHGGMWPDCQCVPDDLYAWLRAELGRPFPFEAYWGPAASLASSRWIAESVEALMADEDRAPDLLLAYLPHLDYDLQRHGPACPQARQALQEALDLLSRIRDAATAADGDLVVFGDYAIAPVTAPPVFPLHALRREGLFRVRTVRGRLYPDYFDSRAVALADHEIGLVYTRDEAATRAARRLFERMDGVGLVLDAEAQRDVGCDEPLGPDLILVAAEGRWFAYPWWDAPREAPDFATHVDIHSKPGYDPCELLRGRRPWRICTEPERIRGTHGRAGPSRPVAWASTVALARAPRHLLDLARAVAESLGGAGLATP